MNSRYEPAPRAAHQTIRVGSNVYMWAGGVNGMPLVHDSQEKRQFISCVEVFHCETGYTSQQVELLHWECVDMAVLQWMIHSTSLVVTVTMVTAIITVFTH